MKTLFSTILSSAIIIFAFSACSNNDPDPQNSVKYELSGNYSGKMLIVTSTNSGKLEQFDNVSVPWTKELNYDETVLGAGLGLQTSGTNVGVPGQTMTLKVYVKGNLKDTKTITADANGLVNSALAFYTF